MRWMAGLLVGSMVGWLVCVSRAEQGQLSSLMASLTDPTVVVPSSTIYCSWQPHTKQWTAPAAHSSAFVDPDAVPCSGPALARVPAWLHDSSHTAGEKTFSHTQALRFWLVVDMWLISFEWLILVYQWLIFSLQMWAGQPMCHCSALNQSDEFYPTWWESHLCISFFHHPSSIMPALFSTSCPSCAPVCFTVQAWGWKKSIANI